MQATSHGVACLLNDLFCINTNLPGSFFVADRDETEGERGKHCAAFAAFEDLIHHISLKELFHYELKIEVAIESVHYCNSQ